MMMRTNSENEGSFENGYDPDESDFDGSYWDDHENSDFDEESHHLKISKIKDKALSRFSNLNRLYSVRNTA